MHLLRFVHTLAFAVNTSLLVLVGSVTAQTFFRNVSGAPVEGPDGIVAALLWRLFDLWFALYGLHVLLSLAAKLYAIRVRPNALFRYSGHLFLLSFSFAVVWIFYGLAIGRSDGSDHAALIRIMLLPQTYAIVLLALANAFYDHRYQGESLPKPKTVPEPQKPM